MKQIIKQEIIRTDTTKGIIALTIAQYPLQSARQIHRYIAQDTCNAVSYQFVHKCLQELKQKNIVIEMKKKYLINKQWAYFMQEIINSFHNTNPKINFSNNCSTLQCERVQ